ncbi:hypothetical protein JW988_01375 [Candidatus Bathyarchaeota archaeon]|nr:hypothetical protein [Candidatus Bathyarchaeota archaeon]
MIYKKRRLLLEVAVLSIVLAFSVVLTPCLATLNSQTSSLRQSQEQSPEDKTDITLCENTEKGYLKLFGYESVENIQSTNTASSGKVAITDVYKVLKNGPAEIVNVESSYQRQNLTPGSHLYHANFTSSAGKEYYVLESVLTTYGPNTVETVVTQKITGEINYSFSATETKTIGDIVTKQINTIIQFSNASGKYYYISNVEGTLSSNEAEIIEAKSEINQNIIGQSGCYTLSYAAAPNFSLLPETSGTWTKCNITTPDGTIIDPWSTGISIPNGGWNGWTRLVGWYWAWMPSEENNEAIMQWIIDGALFVMGAKWKASSLFCDWLFGMLFTYNTQVLFGGDYASSMLYEGHAITVHYHLIELWCGFFPYGFESGYLTDEYNGNPVGGWWYIPLSEATWNLPPLYPCHPLSSPWPVISFSQPSPVYDVDTLAIIDSGIEKTNTGKDDSAMLAQEDSGSETVNSNVWICGDWAGYAGDTFPLPAGTWTIQMEDYGALNHFDIGGYSNSSNPAQFTVSSNMTITAYYDYQPYNWVESINDYGGSVANPENLVGWNPDGQVTTLTGYGPYQYYGWIEAAMDSQATGHICVYGAGYGSLYVYVSSNGYNWNYVSTTQVTQQTPYWVDCGIYTGTFNYIALTTESPSEFSVIDIDAVHAYTTPYFTLTISPSGGGSTNPSPGIHEYLKNSQVPVMANAYSGYVFDHWILDGNTYTQNPITITMNDDHELQAYFAVAPSHYWVASINDYGGPVTNPNNLVGSETDGQYAILTGYGPYQYYGWIEAAMDSQATGHIYVYGCNAGGAGHLYVYVSSNGYSWTPVSSPYVSSSSPYWIDCGTYTGAFNYIAVTVENPSEWPVIALDAVKVEP